MVIQCFQNPKAPTAQIHGQKNLMVRSAWLLIAGEMCASMKMKELVCILRCYLSAVAALQLCVLRAAPAGVCWLFALKAPLKEIQQ